MNGAQWAELVFLALATGSVVLWIKFWLASDPIPYEPRLRVPWGVGGSVLVVFSLVGVLFAHLSGSIAPEADAARDAEQLTSGVLVSVAMTAILLVASLVFAIAAGASLRDLGLPSSLKRFTGDFRLGGLTFLALLAPTLGLQMLLFLIFETGSQHPLITTLTADPDPLLLAAALLSAVLVGPIFEEVAFRLLFQGWLERVEDSALGVTSTARPSKSTLTLDDDGRIASPAADEERDDENPFASPRAPDSGVIEPLSAEEEEHARSFGGLPRGWPPILASSLAFALAHFGNGPDPIPLFVFGIILGYVYQRTHRILPCIIAHGAFNALSLAMLWIQVTMQ